jgi:hypothetical protein
LFQSRIRDAFHRDAQGHFQQSMEHTVSVKFKAALPMSSMKSGGSRVSAGLRLALTAAGFLAVPLAQAASCTAYEAVDGS